MSELDQHIDKFHKNNRAPVQKPYQQQTLFTTDEDLPADGERLPEFAYSSGSYETRREDKPVQRMSRLLEPIAVQRLKIDYLEKVEGTGWVTVDPRLGQQGQVSYSLHENHKVPSLEVTQKKAEAKEPEEMPTSYEVENPDVLMLLLKHSNRVTSQSSGPCLRLVKPHNGEVSEKFPLQKSWDHVREKVELVEVVEATLQPEIGTGGRPRQMEVELEPIDFGAIDLFSSEVLAEEVLFQGRLNKFQAGFKNSFNPKWVVVTHSAFRYYKSMETSI